MFSGGVSSWAAAKRVRASTNNPVILLFCDTNMEDEDLYRFLEQGAENIGAELIRVSDGRTPFDVFKDVGYMGNSRIDPCSRVLKRELADKWVGENFTPTTVTVYVGIDWTEVHRFDRLRERKLPWVYKAPMCDPPLMMKAEQLEWLRSEGIEPPRLYNMGFPHNNCGGFCIRAGQAQFKRLYEQMPNRYLQMERAEQDVYESIGKTHPFLRIVENGVTNYVTLREFRERFLEGGRQCDLFDWGGCGCFVDEVEVEIG